MRLRRIIPAVTAILLAASCPAALPSFNERFEISSSAASEGKTGYLTYILYSDHAEISGCDRAAVSVKIPSSIEGQPVTVIGTGAFSDCEALKELTMPDSITTISSFAFQNCKNMKLEKLPASLTAIGSGSFSYCDQLTDIVLPAGVTDIPDRAFYWCDRLSSFKAEGDIVSIGAKAFIYCSDLVSADFGSNVTYVGENAFRSCNMLSSLSGFDKVETVGYHAFTDCPADVTLSEVSMKGHQSNLISQKYSNTAHVVTSYITDITDDTVSILTSNDNRFVTAEKYSYSGTNYKPLSSKTIPNELPLFGGAYSTDQYNFLFFGQSNYKENNKREVIRIVKYDKSWKRLGSGSVYGSDIYCPFDAGSLRVTDNGKELGVYTCRTMYVSDDGYHHQSSFAFTVNISSMEVRQLDSVYASHSFDQYILPVGNGFRFVDHGDAYPRSVDIQTENGKVAEILKIVGETGENKTGVTLGGFEQSADKLIIAGNSMEQNQSGDINYDARRDIFIAVSDKDLGSYDVKWITGHRNSDSANEPYPTTPRLIKVNDDMFYLMWEEYTPDTDIPELRLTMINGKGEKTSNIFSLGKGNRLSDCQPVISPSGAVTWFYVAEDGDNVHFVSFRPGGDPQPSTQTATQPSTSPVTTSKATSPAPKTTTTPAQTPTSASPTQPPLSADEIRLTCTFSAFTLKKGENVEFTISKPDGVIKQLQIVTTDESGTPSVAIFGGIFSDYLTGPGEKKEFFTAPYALDEIQLIMVYSGTQPECDMAFVYNTPTEKPSEIYGDANCDHVINVADAVAILQYIANNSKYSLSAQGLINADADGYAGITGGDAIAVQKKDAGIADSLPLKPDK